MQTFVTSWNAVSQTWAERMLAVVWQSTVLAVLVALAARLGKGVELWKAIKEQSLGAMESSAAVAGMMVGFKTQAADSNPKR